MKHIHVACAIIERDGLILAARRSATMSLPLKWEFPGGKIDPGESAEDCLRRELLEEMDISVSIGNSLATATHHYPTFSVTLHPFICSIEAGKIVLNEHESIVWLPPEKLLTLDWAEADLPIIEQFLGRGISGGQKGELDFSGPGFPAPLQSVQNFFRHKR